MKNLLCLIGYLLFLSITACAQKQDKKIVNHPPAKKNIENFAHNKLTEEERRVIEDKQTETAYKGKYTKNKETGLYICKRCNAPLYTSDTKFDSHSGWPSFDAEIKDAVEKIPDTDKVRTEIVCNKCKAHLGYIFFGEKFTPTNTRHSVNSISLIFIPAKGGSGP